MTSQERHLAAVLAERQARAELDAAERATVEAMRAEVVASDRWTAAVQAVNEAREALEPATP